MTNLTASILAAASAAKGGHGRQQLPAVLLDLPCTLFTVRTSQLPLARAAALHFSFSPQVQRLADLVIERISADLGAAEVNRTSGFNGLHLRMEADAADWATLLGGKGQLLGLFLQASSCWQPGWAGRMHARACAAAWACVLPPVILAGIRRHCRAGCSIQAMHALHQQAAFV